MTHLGLVLLFFVSFCAHRSGWRQAAWLAIGVLVGILHAYFSIGLAPHRPAPLPRPMPDAEVLVVGDSAAWMWTYANPTAFALLGPRAQNLGLPSYRASHLLADAHRLRGSDARVVVAHIGAADVSTGAEPEAIADDILHALEAVHEAMPDARILVLELVPRRDRVMAWRTDMVNLHLRDGLDLSVIGDAWSLPYATWVPLDVEPGADGVHLSAEGYAELASVLVPLVRGVP